MYIGYVRSVKTNSGYGFIARRDCEDLFFHVNDLEDDVPFDETLTERRVGFNIQVKDGRDRACFVKLLED